MIQVLPLPEGNLLEKHRTFCNAVMFCNNLHRYKKKMGSLKPCGTIVK